MGSVPAETPKRGLLKATDVCEIAKLQPYVLRTWEAEFPDLGLARPNGGPRLYRAADVERVLRIKHLLFVEGLTLAGVRRRLTEERGAQETDEQAPSLLDVLDEETRQRLTDVKRGLRSILDLLTKEAQRVSSGAARSNGSVPGAPALQLPLEHLMGSNGPRAAPKRKRAGR